MSGFVSSNQRLGLRALVFYVIIFSNYLWRDVIFDLPFASFIPFIDQLPTWLYVYFLLPIFLISGALVIIGKYVSASLTTFGLVLLFLIVSSVHVFSNSLTFTCLVILISGLSINHTYAINIQTSILYIGAFINKSFDSDWWNGQFFDTLATIRHPMPLYGFASEYFHHLVLAQIFSIASMFIELSLGILFLFRKKIAFVIGFCFHLSMLVLTQGRLSVLFMFIMSATYLCMLSEEEINYLVKNHQRKKMMIYGWFALLTIWNFRSKISLVYSLMYS